MKLLRLVRWAYSRFFVREVIIVLQVAAMLLLSVPIVSQLANLLSIIRMADDIREPALFFESDQHFFAQSYVTDEDMEEHLHQITSAVEHVGMTAYALGGLPGENTDIFFYNDALVEMTHLRAYLTDDRAWDAKALPVVVNKGLASKYPVGSEIVADSIYFPIVEEYRWNPDIRFVVVGAEDIPYYYHFYGGATVKQLESIARETNTGSNAMIVLSGFDFVPKREIDPSYLLFTEDSPENIEQINQMISEGSASSFSAMRRQSLFMILAANPIPFVLALMMVFLCVGSVASYAYVSIISYKRRFAVYYLCGMSRARGLVITLSSLALLLLVALAAAGALLALTVGKVGFTKNWGVAALLLVIYAAGALTAALRYRGLDPIQMLHQNE